MLVGHVGVDPGGDLQDARLRAIEGAQAAQGVVKPELVVAARIGLQVYEKLVGLRPIVMRPAVEKAAALEVIGSAQADGLFNEGLGRGGSVETQRAVQVEEQRAQAGSQIR